MNTSENGPDFAVYWRTANFFLTGQSIYSATRDGIMTFKYPPWIFPLFIPFGFFSLSIAKLIWGIIEAASLTYAVLWLESRVQIWILILCLVSFSGIWTVHAFDGQVSLPLTACALALFPVFKNNLRNSQSILLTYLLSIKIFTLFPFFGFRLKRDDPLRMILIPLLFAVLSIPALIAHKGSLSDLIYQYRVATGPGVDSSGLPQITVNGNQAQGFVSMIFRLARFDYRNQNLIFALNGIHILCLNFFWQIRSKKLPADVRWAGWLALTATIQPLAGFHTFALAFPLSVLTMNHCLKSKNIPFICLSVVGLVMIAAATQKTMGSTGALLQTLSVKSWGVLLCAILVTISCKKRGYDS
jgi:hypothetical protein